jgi:hypothetical protein
MHTNTRALIIAHLLSPNAAAAAAGILHPKPTARATYTRQVTRTHTLARSHQHARTHTARSAVTARRVGVCSIARTRSATTASFARPCTRRQRDVSCAQLYAHAQRIYLPVQLVRQHADTTHIVTIAPTNTNPAPPPPRSAFQSRRARRDAADADRRARARAPQCRRADWRACAAASARCRAPSAMRNVNTHGEENTRAHTHVDDARAGFQCAQLCRTPRRRRANDDAVHTHLSFGHRATQTSTHLSGKSCTHLIRLPYSMRTLRSQRTHTRAPLATIDVATRRLLSPHALVCGGGGGGGSLMRTQRERLRTLPPTQCPRPSTTRGP